MIASAKKYVTALAAAALVAVAVSACGGGGGGDDDTPTTTNGTPTNVSLSGVTAGFMAESGTVRIAAGQSRDHGDIAFSCAAGGDACTVRVMVGSGGRITATSTGGTVTAMNSDAYQEAVTTRSVGLAGVTPGFMAAAAAFVIEAGKSVVHGDIEFTCAAGRYDCTVRVMVGSGGTVTATKTGGTVTAMNSDAYQEAVTTRSVGLAGVTPGFMAAAATLEIEEGDSVVHGDIEFACAAGRYDCTVTVTVDANGVVTATKTGGTVTAMNSNAYIVRIGLTNEASSIHAATSVDVVIPTFAPNSGSDYVGVVQEGRLAGRTGRAVPWIDAAGNVHFGISIGSGLSETELNPLAWLGRSVDTTTLEQVLLATNAAPNTSPALDNYYREDRNHGLGSDWRVFEAGTRYREAGKLTVTVATDAHTSPIVPEEPGVGYGDFDKLIELDDIPALPADRDWQGVNVAGGVKGSLDGVPGEFTCAQGVSNCWLETWRGADAEGYYPYHGVVFTRDDNGNGEEALQAATTSQAVPTADYLVFGTWQYVPEDVTAVDYYDFGAFAGGGNPYWSFNSAYLDGTATYLGSAHGMYYTGRSSTTPSVGNFEAQAWLSVDFGNMVEHGEVTGFVYDIKYDDPPSGFPEELNFDPTNIFSFPLDFVGPLYAGTEGISAVGQVSGGQATPLWSGTWQAVFYGWDGIANSHPTGVAGTFGATHTNDDDGLVGAFGAQKQ